MGQVGRMVGVEQHPLADVESPAVAPEAAVSGISESRRGNKIDLYLTRYNRWLGEVVGGIFYTKREYKHYFLKYQGFGFNLELIEHLRARGVDYIRVLYTNSQGDIRLLWTSPEEVREWGTPVEEVGYEPQLILRESLFHPAPGWKSVQTRLEVPTP